MLKPFLIAATVAIAPVQAADDSSAAGQSGVVTGSVVVAPACPGPARIDASGCNKRGIRTDVNILVLGAAGGRTKQPTLLKTVGTDADGRFSIVLAPGTYRLLPLASPGISAVKPADVTVTAGSTIDVELSLDSGLR